MTGTYANANPAGEPGMLKTVYEASVGLNLSRCQILWLEAGICSPHIAFESEAGKDCWTPTPCIAADNSPYYAAGVRTPYKTPDEK